MHAAACRSLLLSRSTSLRACRYIAGRRHPVRAFRASTPLRAGTPRDDGGGDSPCDGGVRGAWPHGASSSSSSSSSSAAPNDLQNQPPRSSGEVGDHGEQSRAEDEALAGGARPPAPPPIEPPEGAASASSTTTATTATRQNGKSTKIPYGSGRRRARRSVAQRMVTGMPASARFFTNNVKLWSDVPDGHSLKTEINGGNASSAPDKDVYPSATVGEGAYRIDRNVLFEIQASVNAGMKPAHEADSLPASKAHLILQSPKNGGQAFLDAVVDNVAQRCRADVIKLEAQDIAEYAADHDGTVTADVQTSNLATLGYETHVPFSDRGAKEEQQEDYQDEYAAGEEEEAEATGISKSGSSPFKNATWFAQPVVVSSVSADLSNIFKQLGRSGKQNAAGDKGDASQSALADPHIQPTTSVVLEIIDSSIAELSALRTSVGVDPHGNEEPMFSPQEMPRGIILHVKDYLEMLATPTGGAFIRSLQRLVMDRRKDGTKILLLGTTSSEDLVPSFTQDGWNQIQNESHGPSRTLIVPCTSPDVEDIFKTDLENRNLEINVRHLQDIIKRLSHSQDQTATITSPGNLQLQSALVFSARLGEMVWSFEHLQRLAHTALGLVHQGEEMNADHIEWALNMLESSDKAKMDWLQWDKKQEKKTAGQGAEAGAKSRDVQDERMRKLRKSCNAHEKKLLKGLVERANIKVTFSDVRAGAGTVDALKNLTSLSLIRPDAFKYGVLAAEKIPGLLLYGPPGTGKTLLAKAVARESGATILEVAGADVYDMYVGEGEKNVRAIFSLAKKVSPCVVFIDEADALFGQRSNSGTRNSHREIINQFLREWDGMSEHDTFIMVATNRPFDLDDAVLRRLPRRLLVDLPTEQDRLAILKIHLKEENLADDVDMADIAENTPFYSGSDLKNVCVAAAIAAVREETEAAQKQATCAPAAAEEKTPSSSSSPASTTTDSSTIADASNTETTPSPSTQPSSSSTSPSPSPTPQYPDRRTLRASHFETALADISASISEDMSSLNAIRKFDERYGDRRGRRKKPTGYGFGLLTEKERDKLETGRVRTDQD